MAAPAIRIKIRIQIYCGDEIAFGPGKAELLDAIGAEGSISGAAKALGMSYRRAWLLVDTMNRCWHAPLVTTAPGGTARGGGAKVTELGDRVRAGYRVLVEQAGLAADHATWRDVAMQLLPQPRTRQRDD